MFMWRNASAARAARRLGKQARGDALDAQATKLAERFEAAFWCADIGTYALALDGQKRAMPRADIERRAGAVQRNCSARARERGDARPDASVVFFRLGNPYGGT